MFIVLVAYVEVAKVNVQYASNSVYPHPYPEAHPELAPEFE